MKEMMNNANSMNPILFAAYFAMYLDCLISADRTFLPSGTYVRGALIVFFRSKGNKPDKVAQKAATAVSDFPVSLPSDRKQKACPV
jgi:hypothetical protein